MIPERNTRRHFFSEPKLIYSDKVSKFACRTIERTDGLPLQRFEEVFDRLFIDESQDLAGYDLELVELLLDSDVELLLVADHRQATFSTHSAAKNRKYGGAKVVDKFEEWEAAGLCEIDHHNFSYRCVQPICDFADQFYPDAPNTESRNDSVTDHDGVFAVRERDVEQYVATYNPQALRYNRNTHCPHGKPLNFGASKGMTFERTLIYPHGPLMRFLSTGKLKDAGKEVEKMYVAVTRACQSVALVVGDDAPLNQHRHRDA
jgi:DNA helicase-2/ATP-dependent DNA helicase PcrA